MAIPDSVVRHYARDAIAERVLGALRAEAGAEVAITPDTLAPLDHFHSRGVDATADLLALLAPRPGELVLDIGCGIGGPARWIAVRAGCHVTGVDLTPEFCAAATALTAACGLDRQVRILEGSATDLPLPDAAFDRAYSQNVVMNVADKARFYAEARRVLRAGGVLALSNLAAGPAGPPRYPVPWAASAETSFLSTPETTRADLEAAGFEILAFHDITAAMHAFNEEMREKARSGAKPRLGMAVLVGDALAERRRNTARAIAGGNLLALEILVRKPG
ncbi:MAG: class I SAM-dependent methyltransferase [Rhodospirillales bacterium]|jgi:SAM-dependent methyltransferase|nr:class I SAM-dependent methyltransferase [Rhodospirillales bacterium]